MKTDFSINVNVSIGVTSEVVALVTSILTKQPAQIVAPGTVVSNEPQPEPQAAAKKTRKGKGEATAEAPANDAAGDQPEPEAETPTDQPEDENGESQEITAGDVGSVEDLINFAPEEETE